MPFDASLADRVRKLIEDRPGITERRMFGGVAFLINGNMSVGIHRASLMVRLDPATAPAALREPGARVMDLTGRPMKGWLTVEGPGIATSAALEKWVGRGADYAASLPKKAGRTAAPPPRKAKARAT